MRKELLRLEHATQTYSAERVLDDFKLSLFCGEIASLVGVRVFENDCLMELFSGQSTLTEGTLLFENTPVSLKTEGLPSSLGVRCIRKRPNLIPQLSVSENLFVIKPNAGKFLLNIREIKRQTRYLLREIELPIDEDDIAADLTIADQHCIEILRAIVQKAKLIVMEDIAESYNEEEKKQLIHLLLAAAQENISILYLSFYSSTIFNISDRIFLMHRSQHVRTYFPGDTSAIELGNLVRRLNLVKSTQARDNLTGPVMFEFKDFFNLHMTQPFCAQLHQGEILGVYDNGRGVANEIIHTIFGEGVWKPGSLLVFDQSLEPGDRRVLERHGVLLIPSLKEQNAYLHNLSIEDNLMLPIMRKNALPFFVNNARVSTFAKKAFDQILEDYFCGDNLQGEYLEQCVLYFRCILSRPRIMVCAPAYLCSDALMHKVISTFLHIAVSNQVSAIVFSHDHNELHPICNRIEEIK